MSLRRIFLERKLRKEKALSAQTSGAQFIHGSPLEYSTHKSWRSLYIDSAYRKGMRDAEFDGSGLPKSNQAIHASFLRPVHADKVGILYSRNLESLKGINKAMSQQVREVLSQGLIDGKHPRDLARLVTDRVDKIGITRARVLARTEMVNAHAEASLNSFHEAGVRSVRTEAEFSTAGDDRVCELCEPLSRKVFSLEDARGVIPVHPNCRCAWLPVQTVIPPAQVPQKPSQITKPIPKVVKPGGTPKVPVQAFKPKPRHAKPKPLTPQERATSLRQEVEVLKKQQAAEIAELEGRRQDLIAQIKVAPFERKNALQKQINALKKQEKQLRNPQGKLAKEIKAKEFERKNLNKRLAEFRQAQKEGFTGSFEELGSFVSKKQAAELKAHQAKVKAAEKAAAKARKEGLALRKAELEKFAELEKASLEGKRPWGVDLKANRKGNTWTLNQRGGEFDHSKSLDYQAPETLRDDTRRFFTREYRDVTEEYRKYGRAVSPGVKSIVKGIDSDAKLLKQDYHAYRGVHLPDDPRLAKELENYKPGDPYKQFGPISFSTDPSYSTFRFSRGHTLIQVKLKKGMKVLSDNPAESEMVIPPGYRLRIVEVHKNQIFDQKKMIETHGVWKETTNPMHLKQIIVAELEKAPTKPAKIPITPRPAKPSNADYQATRKIAKELDMAAARSEYTSAYGATQKQVWFASKLMNELDMKPKEFGYGYVNTNAVLTKKRASSLIEELLELKKKAPPPKPITTKKPAPKPKTKLTQQQLELANFRGNKNVLHRRAWAKKNERAKVYEASPNMIKSGDYEGGWGASIKIQEGEKILRGDKVRVTTKAGKSWEATVWEVLFEGDDYVIVSTTETLVK